MRRLVLVVLTLGLAGLGALVDPTRAYACSCVGISSRRAFERADAVFSGRVTAAQEAEAAGDRRVDLRVEVSRVYKGEVYASQLVATPPDSAACGLSPEIGSTWTLFTSTQLYGDGRQAVTRLYTTLCDGNLPTDAPPTLLGRGAAPQPGESDRAERAVATDVRATRVLQVGGLVALGVVAVVAAALIVLWRPRRPPHHP